VSGSFERDPAAVRQFVERFAANLTEGGMPRMPARVFAALLATDPARLTAAELADMLGVSPAAISGAVRYLIQVGIAAREGEPGSRRAYYRLFDDVWYEAAMNRERALTRWEIAAKEGVAALGPGTPAGDRLADTLEFFEFLQNEFAGIMQRWRRHKAQARRLGQPD